MTDPLPREITADEAAALAQRLRATKPEMDAGTIFDVARNPDGREAADAIDSLLRQLAEVTQDRDLWQQAEANCSQMYDRQRARLAVLERGSPAKSPNDPRDWFAGMALATIDSEEAILAARASSRPPAQFIAHLAFELADAMLAAREEPGQ